MIAARLNNWLLGLLGVGPPSVAPVGPKVRHFGIPICYGVDARWEQLPIINLPADALRVKRRIRQGEYASVVVQTPRGVQRGILRPTEDSLTHVTSLTALWNAVNVSYR